MQVEEEKAFIFVGQLVVHESCLNPVLCACCGRGMLFGKTYVEYGRWDNTYDSISNFDSFPHWQYTHNKRVFCVDCFEKYFKPEMIVDVEELDCMNIADYSLWPQGLKSIRCNRIFFGGKTKSANK